jgi:hypothetical protein
MPVKIVEGFEAVETGRPSAQGDLALLAYVHLVLQEDFEELGVAEAIAGGFLEPHPEGGGETGEPELSERCGELGISHEGKGTR